MYFDDRNERNDDKLGKVKDPIARAIKYLKTRSPKEKLALLCAGGLTVSLLSFDPGLQPVIVHSRCVFWKEYLCLKNGEILSRNLIPLIPSAGSLPAVPCDRRSRCLVCYGRISAFLGYWRAPLETNKAAKFWRCVAYVVFEEARLSSRLRFYNLFASRLIS